VSEADYLSSDEWAEEDPDARLRRWLTAWVGIGVAVVTVLAVLMALLGTSLSRINSDLRAADLAVSDVNGSARTLPDQIDRVNRSLAIVDAALQVLPEDTEQIAANLSTVIEALEAVEADLKAAAPDLAGTAKNLEPSAELIGTVGTNLRDTSALLARILSSTGSIHTSLSAIAGKGRTGLAGMHTNLTRVNEILTAVRGELGDITATGVRINEHLARICGSPAVSLRNGSQRC
jgi:hypothetical protein